MTPYAPNFTPGCLCLVIHHPTHAGSVGAVVEFVCFGAPAGYRLRGAGSDCTIRAHGQLYAYGRDWLMPLEGDPDTILAFDIELEQQA